MPKLQDEIIKHTGVSEVVKVQSVQTLWSGYGEIKRYFLRGGKYSSIIVKDIRWPDKINHPRGWNTELSHRRKLKSYQVEKNWYQNFSLLTNDSCKVPRIFQAMEEEGRVLLIMEDLDQSGYNIRLEPESVILDDAKNSLSWLAHFHAVFMGKDPQGLWSMGTYWHLATRPDEWKKMGNVLLKNAARDIDRHLSNAQFQTLVHGDAKLANFCFSEKGDIAAVDFQYVGKGCGMKDVAYFISSCFSEEECGKYEEELITHYFEQLKTSLSKEFDFELIKKEWAELYKYAWADFYRFLDGWSPEHWKMHDYSKRLAEQAIKELAK
ncbi:MAG: phosphotransferase [Bacteroidota bacterium]